MRWTKWSGWFGLMALSLMCAPTAGAGLFDDYDDDLGYESHRTYFIKLMGGFTLQQFDGDLNGGDTLDTTVDFDKDLGLDDAKSYWARLDFQPFLSHHIRFTYTPLSFKGEETIPAGGIRFGGVSLPANEDVDSDFELNAFDFAYQWDALYLGEQLTISPIVNVALLQGDFELEAASGPSHSEDFLVPIPSLGLRFEGYPLHRLGFFGEFKGLTIGKRATTWDAEAGLEFHFFNNLSVNARYRYAVYEADVSGFELDTSVSGPYVGLGFRF